jgi:hypothetical protein
MLSDWKPAYAIAVINNHAFQVSPGRFVVKTVSQAREQVMKLGGLPCSRMWLFQKRARTRRFADPARRAGLGIRRACGGGGICRTSIEIRQAGCRHLRRVVWAGQSRVAERRSASKQCLRVFAGRRLSRGNLNREEKALTEDNIITASGTAPIGFARHIFRKLRIYAEDTLEAWYGLYTTGEMKHFMELQGS